MLFSGLFGRARPPAPHADQSLCFELCNKPILDIFLLRGILLLDSHCTNCSQIMVMSPSITSSDVFLPLNFFSCLVIELGQATNCCSSAPGVKPVDTLYCVTDSTLSLDLKENDILAFYGFSSSHNCDAVCTHRIYVNICYA